LNHLYIKTYPTSYTVQVSDGTNWTEPEIFHTRGKLMKHLNKTVPRILTPYLLAKQQKEKAQ